MQRRTVILLLSHPKGGCERVRSHLSCHRPEILLRLCGVPRKRARPARHQPCRRGRAPHGQDHLSRRHAVAQKLRHFRPRTAVRGAPARQGSEYRPPPRCPGASTLRLVVLLLRTAEQPLPRRGFHHRTAAHGVLHGVQQPHLLHLYEIRRARGHRRLLHRRGVHGCDRLSEHLRSDRA